MTLRAALVTGGGGQLGTDLQELLEPLCNVHAPARAELDVTDAQAVEAALASVSPSVVFNCAAFHNVDECERDDDRSFAVNARAVKRLAEACAARGAKLVHISTNYVFDGARQEPYGEDDVPAPRSVYAISKLAGEHAALAYEPGALVVRTAGLYGLGGSASKGGNFVTRMIDKAGHEGRLRMVADQRLSPTFTADLAASLVEAVRNQAQGLVHVTNSGECSWYEFTVRIMDLAGLDVPVEPVETSRAPGTPDRPLNGVLARRARGGGVPELRPWEDALDDYMARAGLRTGSAQPS